MASNRVVNSCDAITFDELKSLVLLIVKARNSPELCTTPRIQLAVSSVVGDMVDTFDIRAAVEDLAYAGKVEFVSPSYGLRIKKG